jgi:hypothetical protein
LKSGTVDSFTATAAQTAFTLSEIPLNANSIHVYVNGIYQKPITNYTVTGSSTTLTLSSGILVGDEVDVHHNTLRSTVSHVPDAGVTTTKIADDAVTTAKLDTNIAVGGTFGVTGATTLSNSLAVTGTSTTFGIGSSSHVNIPSVTTANLPGASGGTNASVTATNGMLVYNTTLGMLQQYAAGVWSGITTAPVITSFQYSDGASATAEKTVATVISCTTQTSTTVLVPGVTSAIIVGQVVSGAGVPLGATVVSIVTDTSFVLSSAATESATINLTFGGVITITGTNFDSILAGGSANIGVTFGGTSATAISVNAAKTIITCTPPAHAAGTVSLQVSNASGLTAETDFIYDEEAIFTTAAGSLGSFLDGVYTANADAPRIQATDGEGSPSALTTGFERVTSASDDTVITTTIQGLTVLTSGYLTGTLSATEGTTYPFYATAKDSQNQRTAPRLFNIISLAPVVATGGTVVTSLSGFKIHVFTTGGTFAVSGAGDIDYLVVAGGGGVMSYSGGAGAGGVRTLGGYAVTAQNYVISIGAGGIAGTINGTSPLATSGGNSTIVPASGTTITATGGGYGARAAATPITGGSGGGRGTGASAEAGAAGNVGGTLNGLPEGFAGGASSSSNTNTAYPAGGGGGAGGVGGDGGVGDNSTGGAGGVGLKVIMGLSDSDSTLVLAAASAGVVSGSYRYIAGGGGGGSRAITAGAGGLGGGGIGSVGTANNSGAGVANTGGGAGGVGGLGGVGSTKAGGSGIVIIRYAV